MATPRKVHCPFCNYRNTKEKVIRHIEKSHRDMIPAADESGEYTAARVLFNFLNHKNHGICVVCKRPTKWNSNTNKYDRLCGRKECSDALRKKYKSNMIKVYGKTTLLDNPEQQKKMLAKRHISGEYIFSDGTKREFTGSYEKKLLEFLDKVLGFDSKDVMTPGPTFEYNFKGKKHVWITDALIIPYNLVIEVKDGGDNPNKRSMPEYRAKQIAKETMITNLGTFNYIRLTNNDFAQLIAIFYKLKMQMLDDSEENDRVIIDINEETERLRNMDIYSKEMFPSTYNDLFVECTNPSDNLKTYYFKEDGETACSLKIDTKLKCIVEASYNIKYDMSYLEKAVDYAVEKLGVIYALAESDASKRFYKKKSFKTVDPKTGKSVMKFNGKKGKKDIPNSSKLNKTMNEYTIYQDMGLAGIGGPIGMFNSPFIVQYNRLSGNTFSDRAEYGLQNDIKTDNLIIRDSDGILKKVPHSFLNDTKFKVFKYKGKNKNGMGKVLKRLGEQVEEDFIYNQFSDNKIISDDQLMFDEDFEYIDLPAIKQYIINDAYTLIAKMQCLINKNGVPSGRIISSNESIEVDNLLEGKNPNIIIMQNTPGFYAINRKTLRRTNYFDKISDIFITEDLDE